MGRTRREAEVTTLPDWRHGRSWSLRALPRKAWDKALIGLPNTQHCAHLKLTLVFWAPFPGVWMR